jgi:carbamoyl-phosphate synthase large subunit
MAKNSLLATYPVHQPPAAATAAASAVHVSAGKVFISMADKYKADAVGIAKQLTDMGYQVVATRGTASTLMSAGAGIAEQIPCAAQAA